MTFTREQLKAMQSAGVPVEERTATGWCSGAWWSFCFPPENYRPRPGHTFGADVARKLDAAGVAVDDKCAVSPEWERWGGEVDRCHMCCKALIFRIAEAEPAEARCETDCDRLEEIRMALACDQEPTNPYAESTIEHGIYELRARLREATTPVVEATQREVPTTPTSFTHTREQLLSRADDWCRKNLVNDDGQRAESYYATLGILVDYINDLTPD